VRRAIPFLLLGILVFGTGIAIGAATGRSGTGTGTGSGSGSHSAEPPSSPRPGFRRSCPLFTRSEAAHLLHRRVIDALGSSSNRFCDYQAAQAPRGHEAPSITIIEIEGRREILAFTALMNAGSRLHCGTALTQAVCAGVPKRHVATIGGLRVLWDQATAPISNAVTGTAFVVETGRAVLVSTIGMRDPGQTALEVMRYVVPRL